jgi:hypothetical protein
MRFVRLIALPRKPKAPDTVLRAAARPADRF